MFRVLFTSLTFLLLCFFCTGLVSFAQNSDQLGTGLDSTTKTRLSTLTTSLRNYEDIDLNYVALAFYQTDNESNAEQRLTLQRRALSDIIFERVEGDPALYFEAYQSTAKNASSFADSEIGSLYMDYWNSRAEGPGSENGKQFLARLEDYKTSEYWWVRQRAWIIESMFYGKAFDIHPALEAANQAGAIIPETVSDMTVEASFELNSVTNPVYFMVGDARLGTLAVESFLEQGQQQNRHIDVSTIYNNLIFVTARWREYSLMEEISRAAYERASETGETPDQVMASARLSQALNFQGKFEEAETIAAQGLDIADRPAWNLALEYQYAMSLAGQGKTVEARQSKTRIDRIMRENPRLRQVNHVKENQLQAVLAMSENRPRDVYDYLMANMQIEMQWQLQSSDQNTQSLLSSVERDREVQIAKQREAETLAANEKLRADAATRQLWIVVGVALLLLIGAVLSGVFAIYKTRINKQLMISNERAKAGERAKTDFLAVMSHELRTPLNGVIALSDLLSREGPDDQTRFQSGVILKSGLTLLDLLTNILDMAKMERGQLSIAREATNVRETLISLKNLWEARAQRKDLTYTVHIADDIPRWLHIDPMRLRQCAENLISNALKFTKSGRVHVHVTGKHINDKKSPYRLTIIVADTGQGMTEQQISEVFNPFTQADTSITREFGGSGLGLAITRTLARLMDGDVTVISKEQRGSEFTLTFGTRESTAEEIENRTGTAIEPSAKSQIEELESNEEFAALLTGEIPLTDIQDVEENTTDAAKVVSVMEDIFNADEAPDTGNDVFNDLRVLFAEDAINNQAVIRALLEPLGASVTCVDNGREAVDTVKSEPFDIILMDIRMPELNGIKATQQIRRSLSHDLPIIALTADASAENNARCMAAGANLFLTKPVVASELFSAIRFVLRKSEQAKDRFSA